MPWLDKGDYLTSQWDTFSGLKKHFCPSRAGRNLAKWFCSVQGQYILRTELALLKQLGEGLCGYHLMQLSYATSQQPLYAFGHTHCFNLSAIPEAQGNAVTEYESLPLPSETIDTGVLHHVLEYSHNPHRVLSEASRVIVPGGHLVLVMFNPMSLLGIARWPVRPFSSSAIWHYRGLRSSRVIDWLQLLHFQPVATGMESLLFPVRCQKPIPRAGDFIKKMAGNGFLLGSITVVVARKMLFRSSFGNGVPLRGKQAMGLNLQCAQNSGASVIDGGSL